MPTLIGKGKGKQARNRIKRALGTGTQDSCLARSRPFPRAPSLINEENKDKVVLPLRNEAPEAEER